MFTSKKFELVVDSKIIIILLASGVPPTAVATVPTALLGVVEDNAPPA